MDLRKLAKGRECQVRIPRHCNHNPETTVLAHYRLAGLCGIGMKPDDMIGAWACSECHRICDGGKTDHDRQAVRLMHAEGVMRTMAQIRQLKREGGL